MVACLFGASSLPTLHFSCPPARTFSHLSPVHFAITLSITQPVVVTVSLLTADYRPHILSISPQQPYHFPESTTHKFENIYIKEASEDRTQELQSREELVEGLAKSTECVRIMVEAATPSASSVIVSDTIYVDQESLEVVDVSTHVVNNYKDSIWVLLNKEVVEAEVLIVDGDSAQKAHNVRLYGKVLIFSLPSPQDESANKVDGSVNVRISVGGQQCSFPLSLATRREPSSNATCEKSVLEESGDESPLVRSLFAFASEGDPLALVGPLVPHLSSADIDKCNALHLAARNKQNFALKTMLTALREANGGGELQEVLNARNARGQTPLHCAVRAGDADCVHYLVSAGADKHLTDNNLNTVTHYLGEVYNEAIYKEILETSSNDESPASEQVKENPLAWRNSDGYTPAHIAVRKLKLGLLEALIEAGAPIDTPDNDDQTPLITAVFMDDLEVATLLIKHKCNVNAEAKNGDTPLLIACGKKNLSLIGRLLDAGADPDQANKEGKKPRDCEDEDVQKILGGERIEPEESQPEEAEVRPRESSPEDGEQAAALSYRLHAMNADDISSLDYLTRLRLSKILDADDKWATLADHLGCAHMVEFIRVCTDESSSPTMILLDQYEQVPNANLATVTKSLEDMGETLGVRLIRNGNEHE